MNDVNRPSGDRPRRDRPKTSRTFYGHNQHQMNDLIAKLTEQVETLAARIETLELSKNNNTTTNNNNITNDTQSKLVRDSDRPPRSSRVNRRNERRSGPRKSSSNVPQQSTQQQQPTSQLQQQQQQQPLQQGSNRSGPNQDLQNKDDGQSGTNGAAPPPLSARPPGRKRQTYYNRRNNRPRSRRVDSSERNSNDTSPHNEVNGYDDTNNRSNHGSASENNNNRNHTREYPQLTEEKMYEVIQTLKRQFDSADRKAVKNTLNSKGPKVAYEFAIHILDYAIGETSPANLKETANNLLYLISGEGGNNHKVDFQAAFYKALTNISDREHQIAIDAPRYLDTLGQLLADSVILQVDNPKLKGHVKRFIEKCVNSYNDENRAAFLASIVKGLENSKDQDFAKEVWNQAQLSWEQYKIEDKLEDFLDQHGVKFTI